MDTASAASRRPMRSGDLKRLAFRSFEKRFNLQEAAVLQFSMKGCKELSLDKILLGRSGDGATSWRLSSGRSRSTFVLFF